MIIIFRYNYSRSKRFQTSVANCLSFVMVQDPVNREGWTADDVSERLQCKWADFYHWKRWPEFLWPDESDSIPEALETDKEVKRSYKFWQPKSKIITRWWSAQLNSVFPNCKNWKILLEECPSIILVGLAWRGVLSGCYTLQGVFATETEVQWQTTAVLISFSGSKG